MIPPRKVTEDPGMAVSASPSMPPVRDSATATVCPCARSNRCTTTSSDSSPCPDDQVAEDAAHPLERVGHRLRAAPGAAGSGGDAHAELAALGQVRQPHASRQRRLDGAQQRGHRRLPGQGDPQPPRAHDLLGAGALEQLRQHRRGKHHPHLTGHPGQGPDRRPARPPTRPPDACTRRSRRGPGGIGQHSAPRGTSAWRSAAAGVARWCRAYHCSRPATSEALRSRGTPAQAARASRVRSSEVEPRPPVSTTASARPSRPPARR